MTKPNLAPTPSQMLHLRLSIAAADHPDDPEGNQRLGVETRRALHDAGVRPPRVG